MTNFRSLTSERICYLIATLYIRVHTYIRTYTSVQNSCTYYVGVSSCMYTSRGRTCARRTHALQRSRTSIGDHESTSEGKPSSGGWSGLAAFYHILLYMRERFFSPWHRRLLSSLLRVRRGGWSLRISLGRDAARSISLLSDCQHAFHSEILH